MFSRLPARLFALALPGLLTACEGQQAVTANQSAMSPAEPRAQDAPDGYSAGPAGQADSGPPAAAPQEAPKPYELHGIIDPGLNNMVAYALKTPRGWQLQQSFTRSWNGSTPINQVYLRLTAPDGQSQIEYLPTTPYYYQDGPTVRSLRQQAAAMGYQQPAAPNEAAPVPPLVYLKHAVLPQLARQGLRLTPTAEQALPARPSGAGQTTTAAYIDGTLPNGRRARVECTIVCLTTNAGDAVYYQWQATPSLTQTSQDLAAVYAQTKAIEQSVVVNPAWQQQSNQLARNGNQANAAIAARDAANLQAYRDNQRRNQEDLTRQRQASQDRNHAAFRDALGGEARYEDQHGQRVNVQDQYAHVYKDRQGYYYGSSAPVDAGQLDWEELARVETRRY
jgi:hypothetical protein